jgi:hypothetical protein
MGVHRAFQAVAPSQSLGAGSLDCADSDERLVAGWQIFDHRIIHFALGDRNSHWSQGTAKQGKDPESVAGRKKE